MKIRIIIQFMLFVVGSICFGSDSLAYYISVAKDTVCIGEPIILKCTLINVSNHEISILPYPATGLMTYDCMDFYMNISCDQKPYTYGVSVHSDVNSHLDTLFLEPSDTVYCFMILSWGGFTYLKYKDLKEGVFKINSKYFSLVSNTDSFYAIKMLPEDEAIFQRFGKIIDDYWAWPEGCWPNITQIILDSFPEIIEKNNSVFIPFCHYMLWRKSFKDESKTATLTEKFFKFYAGTPLAEKFSFDLYRYHGWYMQDIEKGRIDIMDALKKYPNNLLGYFYLKMRHKNERLK